MRVIKTFFVTLLLVAIAAVVLIYSGIYNVAADNPDNKLERWVLHTVRERSIESQSKSVQAPALDDPAMIAEGAEHYDNMCVMCHLAPGLENTKMRQGLNPRPPNLARRAHGDPGENFWIVKHGIKMTGMPAWGATHDDQELWNIVAFLRRMPDLTPAEYQAMTNPAPAPAPMEEHGMEMDEQGAETDSAPADQDMESEPGQDEQAPEQEDGSGEGGEGSGQA